jgi:hypothetical protein
MATTATVNVSITYTPPAGATNSATASLATAASNSAQNVGVIDVPSGTGPAATFPIPFGSVAAAKILIVKNAMSSDLGVQLNGSGTDIYQISAGGMMMIGMPTEPGADTLTDATITVIDAITSAQTVQFWVFGD